MSNDIGKPRHTSFKHSHSPCFRDERIKVNEEKYNGITNREASGGDTRKGREHEAS
jgi:hypothetical protein